MPPISIMLKPSSSLCNLRCKYCFYSALASERNIYSTGLMSNGTAREVIVKALDYARGTSINFVFQGGEPLIVGKEFYRQFLRLIQENNTAPRTKITFGIQTNGTLIDKEWCKIFREYDFLVGLSLDGDEFTNRHRVNADGENSFSSIMRASELLTSEGVEFNILTVLTKAIANNAERVYEFYKAHDFKYLQFINCLRPFDGDYDSSIYMTDDEYLAFLKTTFTLYFNDYMAGNYTSIRFFDNLVHLTHRRPAEQCGMNGFCSHQIVVEGDGTLYPCDFYCIDEYALGNINSTDFYALAKDKRAIKFITDSLIVPDKCKACDVFALCRGGCKRYECNTSQCYVFKNFLTFAIPYLEQMN